MKVLAYVHLRNIYGSTGAGRVARQITEHLALDPDIDLKILADAADYHRIIPKVGKPWNQFDYRFFKNETSVQQAIWLLTHSPQVESYWPEAEIVYCTGESYVPSKRARSVVTLHDAAFFENSAHKTNFNTLKQKWKWKFLYSILAENVDCFHTVSEFSATRIAYFFPAIKSRLRVIPNAVPPRFFNPPSNEGDLFLTLNNLYKNSFILLPRGLHYRKNADLVLQAWPIIKQKYPDLRLVVTSHCDPFYAEKAKKMGNSVFLTGFVNDEVLCSLYHHAQMIWFPSLYEGFGIPILEAMACGTPVVSSNTSSLPEVAGGAAILVSPEKIEAHIDAIGTLIDDSSLRNKMIHLGKARAQSFTWQKSAEKLKQVFLSLY